MAPKPKNSQQSTPTEFPYKLTLRIPFQTHRHANVALTSLETDPELSPLVQRSLSLAANTANPRGIRSASADQPGHVKPQDPNNPAPVPNDVNTVDRARGALDEIKKVRGATREKYSEQGEEAVARGIRDDERGEQTKDAMTVLVADYAATTDRMLRVAVNGFFESARVVIETVRELDVEDTANGDEVLKGSVDREWMGDGESELDKLKRVQGLEESGVLGTVSR